MRHSSLGIVILAILTVILTSAATVRGEIPRIISYQGKVTDSGGTPVADGTYTMRFWIYDAATGGTSPWNSGDQSVDVSGGVFNVLLGENPQSEIDLPFDQDYWLLVRFQGVNQLPRQRLSSVGYAYMASGLVAGSEVIGSVTSGTWSAIKARNTATAGFTYGGQFHSASPNGRAVFGWATASTGATVGGQFWAASTDGKGVQGYAIANTGTTYGVYGESSSTAGTGVYGKALAGSGTTYGLYGASNSSSGRGVYGHGTATTGNAYGVFGETASMWGRGVRGYASATTGTTHGVHGESSSTSGIGVYGFVGTAAGVTHGGYFASFSNSGIGVYAQGATGGSFQCYTSAYCDVALSTYKVQGNGTVSFVQNHPEDNDRIIVYAAPEGDEVATYTRGAARLTNGEARVPLGDTFKWVTNPDIGLTAHITPRGSWADLYVKSVSIRELVVASKDSTGDGMFDYIVYGLRIGFEEVSIVQEKQREAYIPSMTDHRDEYAAHPELRQYNALERFKAMRGAVGVSKALDLSASEELREAIVEFDPAIHGLSGRGEESGRRQEERERLSAEFERMEAERQRIEQERKRIASSRQ